MSNPAFEKYIELLANSYNELNKIGHFEQVDLNANEINNERNVKSNKVEETIKIEIDENGDSWIDKKSGLILKNNKLVYVSSSTLEEFPTLITDNVIWIAKNIANKSNDELDFEINENWLLPAKEDWDLLSRFIAKKNNIPLHLNRETSTIIAGEECHSNDKLTCIQSTNGGLTEEGREYFLFGFDSNGIYLWDVKQPNSNKLAPISSKKFKLKEKWRTGNYFYDFDVKCFNFSFLHPKYKIANKFGINYSESTFLVKNHKSEKLSGIVVEKNFSPYLIDLANFEQLGIRCFLPITRSIKRSLLAANYEFPEYLEYNEIIEY